MGYTEKIAEFRWYRRGPAQVCVVAVVIALATLLAMAFRRFGFSEINIPVVYVLAVLVIARLTKGYLYGIGASVLNIFCFNYFFTEPYYTFHVYNRDYMTTFIVMLFASVLTSALTSKILDSSAAAGRSEKQAKMLYQITSSLAKASSVADVATVSVRCLSNLLGCDVSCVTMDEQNRPSQEYTVHSGEHGVTVRGITAEQAEQVFQGKTVLPIANLPHQYAAICFPPESAGKNADRGKMISSVCMQICVAMERERLASEKEAVKAEAEREKFKSSLLRAISHDLRTPLAGISGAAEVLLYSLKEEDSLRMAQGIYDDSSWLARMVENILSLTKIEEGKMIVCTNEEAAEEIVGEAVQRASRYADTRKITVKLPEEVLFVPMDGRLIEQVLINLIDNAVKHTQPADEIKVEIRPEATRVWFAVSDSGSGIPPEDMPKIFDLFYRADSPHADSRRGMGLGLAICKAIVNAHGGKIYAENNETGGACVRFYLPVKGGAPVDREL